jgi:hypothetical protein
MEIAMKFRLTNQGTNWRAAAIAAVLLTGSMADARANDQMVAPRRPTICTEQYLPVCGQRGSVIKTYSNACFARADGAKVIAQGPCSNETHAPLPK